MSDQQFDIIFRGDIVFGHQLADVKARLQQLFKADAAKVDALFSGRPVPLKRGLDQASAQKYKEALLKAGAQVDIIAMGEIKPATSPVAPPQSVAPPQPVALSESAQPPTPSAPLTLAQRLAQQETARLEAEAEAEKNEITRREQAARETGPSAAGPAPSWSLAPVGADLLGPAEKVVQEPLTIDTSSISLRAEGGNLLDATEQTPAPVITVVVPNYEVAEAGADLVRADEKMDLPLLEVELENWGLADLGEDLIDAAEKPVMKVPAIQVLDVGLAPVGTDLGQLKPQIEAVVPDTSGLRLAD